VFTWQNQYDEFRQAVEDGRARSLLFWERRAVALANGEPGNAAVVTLGLKNRSRAASGWHDAQRLEHSGPEGEAIRAEAVQPRVNLDGLNDEQLGAIEAALRLALGSPS
jgi:hypothetical protein